MIAIIAAAVGIIVLAVSISGGHVVSFETVVGVLFLAVAVVRYRLAQGE